MFMLIASHRVDLNSRWLESDPTSDSFSLSLLFSHSRACHFVVHCFMHWSLSYTFYFQLSNLVELSVSTIATGRAKSPNQFSLSFLREWCHIFNEKQCWCWTARAAPLTHQKKTTTTYNTTSKQTQKLSHFQFTVDLLFDCADGLPGWIETKSWIVSFLPLYWWAHCFPPSCCRLRRWSVNFATTQCDEFMCTCAVRMKDLCDIWLDSKLCAHNRAAIEFMFRCARKFYLVWHNLHSHLDMTAFTLSCGHAASRQLAH